jgi:DNA-directed RNA polymerase specialized sigma24 family protein
MVRAAETDRYYVERCLDGHPEDFRCLVERYQKALLAGIRIRRARADWVEEAAQETLVRAFLNLGRLHKPESFFAWLMGIAHHVLQELGERERRERDRLAQYARETGAGSADGSWSGDAAESSLHDRPSIRLAAAPRPRRSRSCGS